MRISILEKRENFYKILEESLSNSSFFLKKDKKYILYFANKYLNFVSTTHLPTNAFRALVNEYSSAKSWFKTLIQSAIVWLSIQRFSRKLFSHKAISLSSTYSEYLIVGGNHRLRLFTKTMSDTIVILKKGENTSFIDNDIFIRKNNKLKYAPLLKEYGIDWLKEEYFEGKPVNRINNKIKTDKIITEVINIHWTELIEKKNHKITKSEYVKTILNQVSDIIENKKIKSKKLIIDTLNNTFKNLFERLLNIDINISWSHGDFQQANILVNENQFKVIDWEAAKSRFVYYDIFTLLSGIRTGRNLKETIKFFKTEVVKFDFITSVTDNDIILLLIEELRFRVDEDFSENFYFSGKHTQKLCRDITKFLDE